VFSLDIASGNLSDSNVSLWYGERSHPDSFQPTGPTPADDTILWNSTRASLLQNLPHPSLRNHTGLRQYLCDPEIVRQVKLDVSSEEPRSASRRVFRIEEYDD